jgi:hypothetical protein
VIHPAKTGKDNNNKTAVIITAHKYKLILNNSNFFERIFKIVVMKLIAPAIEETPAKCKLKILKSTANPQ